MRQHLFDEKESVKHHELKICTWLRTMVGGNGQTCQCQREMKSCPDGTRLPRIPRAGMLMTHDCAIGASRDRLSGSSQTSGDRFGNAVTVESGLQSDGIRGLRLGVTDKSFRVRTTVVVNIIK